jgi:hypothetical protein
MVAESINTFHLMKDKTSLEKTDFSYGGATNGF